MGSEEAAGVAGNGGAGHGLAGGVDDRRGLGAGGPDAAASAAQAAGAAGGSSGSERAVDDRLQGAVRTGDWVWLCPLTVQDAHSRYLLGCAGHRQVSGPATRATLQKVFREHGLPERLRSDNGSPFASVGASRLSKLAGWWLKLGIELERIQPGKPQQNGRHERMHRVLKAKTARPPAGGALRPLPRRAQPRPPARGAGAADAGQRACAFGPGVSGTGAGSGIPAALGAAPGAPGRFAEVPRAAAASQRGPREFVGLVEIEEELRQIWFCD